MTPLRCSALLFTCISLQKTADAYADDFESEISKATPRPQPQVQSPTDKQTDKLRPSPLSPLGTSALRRNSSSASESIAEESIAESIQSVQVRIRRGNVMFRYFFDNKKGECDKFDHFMIIKRANQVQR